MAPTVFGLNPLLKIKDLSIEKQSEPVKVWNRITEGLQEGLCYYVFWDHFYIGGTKEYEKTHDAHDVLITKCEDDFIVYQENVLGAYKDYKCSKSDVENAFINCKDCCTFEMKADDTYEYCFDARRFSRMLYEFIYAIPPKNYDMYFYRNGFYSDGFYEGKKKNTIAYGTSVYEKIASSIEEQIAQKTMIDYRTVFLFREHMHNMQAKVNFLLGKYYLQNDEAEYLNQIFAGCENAFNVMMCKIVKYDFQYKAEVVEDVPEKIIIEGSKARSAMIELYNCFL